MLRKDYSEWVSKCINSVVEDVRPRGRPENLEGSSRGDMKSLKLSKEDALVRSKWRQLIRLRGTVKDRDDSGD